MRIRAGVVLIENNKVALIEHYRAGFYYLIFPGGGVDEGESVEKAAIRETLEELGVEVTIQQKVAEIYFGQKSRQLYFLVEEIGGKFGTGTGEEFASSNLDNPQKGIYIPIWMPIDELSGLTNVYPADVAQLVLKSINEGWLQAPILTYEASK